MSLYLGNKLVAPALTNSANNDLSNLSSAGQQIIDNKVNINSNVIDGLPIPSKYTIVSDSALSSSDKEYDLSSYLPDDGQLYNVLFTAYSVTAPTDPKYSATIIQTDYWNVDVALSWCRTGVDVLMDTHGGCWVPVGTGRKVIIKGQSSSNYSSSGKQSLVACGYRRIGTNV